MRRRAAAVWLLLICILCCSCGKNIPVISDSELQQKHAVLVITSDRASAQTEAAVLSSLNIWRQSHQISYEWAKGITAVGNELIDKINRIPYDYVLVIGGSLMRSSLEAAASLQDKRWILLDDSFTDATLDTKGSNVLYRGTEAALWKQQWDPWVREQQLLGVSIEWLTDSSNPIPSLWAPSEEADHIVLLDSGAAWYNQLNFQVHQHGSRWVAVYTSIDSTVQSRLKSINASVIQMAAVQLEPRWELILNSVLDPILKNSWNPGVQNYREDEYAIKK
jgi:hypothetical protein